MAYALEEVGANLVLAARNLGRCKEATGKMEKDLGIKVLPAKADVISIDKIDSLYDLVIKELGG